ERKAYQDKFHDVDVGVNSVCLSVWGEDVPRSGLPTLEELLSSFHSSLHHQAFAQEILKF
ncbi:hypothetical protein AK812_SmicGene45923, partial [Symbiodinium microadriaticum]